MERLFIAVYPSEEIIEKIVNFQDEVKDLFTGRLANKESLHITLQFLGNINENDKIIISENIKKSIYNVSPFEVIYHSVGFFKDIYNPRILWAGAEDQNGMLTQIANKLKKENSKFIKKDNRKFIPHITLARIKSIKIEDAMMLKDKYKDREFGKELVKEICLVKSELSKTGSKYSILEKFSLK